jgi:uncharacterized protein YcaQ
LDQAGFGRGKTGVLEAIRHLGYVQIDTIAVVERAHHHTLWSRLADYRPAQLDELQAKDRKVFEYWSHAASFLPVQDYRYSLPRMRAIASGQRHWFRRNRKLMEAVLKRIATEGPLSASDFEAPPGSRRRNWFDWKPAKRALEQLFMEGRIMVDRRRGFQKVYDLPERVLPPGVDTSMPTPLELGRHLVTRALEAQGLMSEKEIGYLRSRDRSAIRLALAAMREEGAVRALSVEGIAGETFYALEAGLGTAALAARPATDRVHLLSPFDNAVIQRRRLSRLFGFDYQIECYVPEPKRRYGYFCLPILWGDRFVGRLDPKAERARGRLTVRSLAFEPGFKSKGELRPLLADALARFAAFNGCDTVEGLP